MTRGEPDAEVVQRHIGAMRQALANLRRHAGLTVEELRGDSDLRWIVERGLQLTIQNALDISTHFSASSGLDAPDYATAIDRLTELSVISSELASRLRPMAGSWCMPTWTSTLAYCNAFSANTSQISSLSQIRSTHT